MLRLLVALLIVANLAFLAWTRGWLEPVVSRPAEDDRDPQRLARQVQPDAVQVLPPEPAASRPARDAAPAVTACLEAGPFSDADIGEMEKTLAAAGVPPARWQAVTVDRPGQWGVYMGRFADADTLQRKQGELDRMHLHYEPVRNAPALEPGLVLGRYPDKPSADAALLKLANRGVHTAKVIELAPPSQAELLRVDAADEALAQRLRTLRGAAGDTAPLFRPCAGG